MGQEQEQGQEAQDQQAAPEAQPSEADIIQAAIDAADSQVQLGDTDAPPEVEQPAPEEPPAPEQPTPEEVRHLQRLREIQRREQQLLQQQNELKQQNEQMKQLQAQVAEMGDFKKAFQKDPFGVMRKEGIDILDLLGTTEGDDAAQDPKLTEQFNALQQRIDQLEAARQKEREQAEQQRKQSLEQQETLSAYQTIHSAIADQSQDYEAVLERGQAGVADVFKALESMWGQIQLETGQAPPAPGPDDIRRAAAVVEKVYREQELEHIRHLAGRSRFAGQVALTPGGPSNAIAAPATVSQASNQQKPNTLTNQLQATPPQKRELLTEEERLAAAMKIPFEPVEE